APRRRGVRRSSHAAQGDPRHGAAGDLAHRAPVAPTPARARLRRPRRDHGHAPQRSAVLPPDRGPPCGHGAPARRLRPSHRPRSARAAPDRKELTGMDFVTTALILAWAAILLLALVVSRLVHQVHRLSGRDRRPAPLGLPPGSPAL